jgi:tetratricopeptide (TPR) repeat protein/DNA-binding CsgD family transcriptional regulator
MQGNFPAALAKYREALAINEEIKYKSGVAKDLMHIGTVYYSNNRFAEALDYFKESLRLREDLKDKSGIAKIWLNLGATYNKLRNNSLALDAYKKSLALSTELEKPGDVALSLYNIGNVYVDLTNFREAIVYYQQSFEIASSLNDKRALSYAYEGFSKVYNKDKNYNQSIVAAQKGIALSEEIGELEQIITFRKLLVENYKALGQFEKALAFHEQYKIGYDSLFSVNKTKEIARIESGIEIAKREEEISILQKDKQINVLIIGSTSLITVLLALLVFAYRRNYKRLHEESKLTSALMQKENELLGQRTLLAETQLDRARAVEEKLKSEVEYKSKELTTYTLHLIQKNEMLEEIRNAVDEIRTFPEESLRQRLKSIATSISLNFQIDKDWDTFRLHFENVHGSFFETLRTRYPDLTMGELKLCALIKLNLDTRKISTILGISADSVKTSRYRLRKKLNISTEENLGIFLDTLK